MRKTNNSDSSEVREKILSGVTKMADLVSLTLGPAGGSVLIERGTAEPLIVDDGRRVAENIKLDDPIEQLAVRVCYSVTRKTDEKAGDGTTTSMVLAHAILKEVFGERLGVGLQFNVAELDYEIKKAKDEVMALLTEAAKEIKTEADLINVASVVSGDEKLGKIIGEMYHKLGKDGHISLEFNLLSEEIESEVAKGYRFSGGYAAPWMISSALRKNLELEDCDILITKRKITDFKNEIMPIANVVGNAGKRRMAIIAPKFAPSVITLAYQNATRLKQPFLIACIRAPGQVLEAYQDMAVFTGGKFFDEADKIEFATMADLGHVDSLEATDDTTILIGGRGKEADVKARIAEVEAELKSQKLHQFKQPRLERISALSGGVGVIRIGAPTDEERNWLKYKIEDAKYATKHAFRDGIIPGGGITLKKISEKLPDSNILKRPLLAPYEKLKSNAGGKLVVGKNVFDPVIVEKAALEYACSAVSKLIRIGGAIAMLPPPNLEEAIKAVIGGGEGVDNLIEEDHD